MSEQTPKIPPWAHWVVALAGALLLALLLARALRSEEEPPEEWVTVERVEDLKHTIALGERLLSERTDWAPGMRQALEVTLVHLRQAMTQVVVASMGVDGA